MFRGLLYKVPYFLRRLRNVLPTRAKTPSAAAVRIPVRASLARVVLTDGVMRTLFEDYAGHRRTVRGDEEIGWVLLGIFENNEAIALAALPAGADREASASHVRFNADAQALASRILRQDDKRLEVVGIVHTHPGALRYPSDGDLLGDSRWVGQLRKGVAVFGIGTAAGQMQDAGDADIFSEFAFSWYSLGIGDSRYHPLPTVVQNGADLAHSLRPIWGLIETYAGSLNRLGRQLAKMQIDVIDEGPHKLLGVRIALAEPNQQLRVLLGATQARYYWDKEGELIAVEPSERDVERAVYLILAELANRSAGTLLEPRMLVES